MSGFPYTWVFKAKDTGRYWSTASASFINEAAVAVWVSEGDYRTPTTLETEDEITRAISVYGLRGPTVTIDDVVAERVRRLAIGFDYDFGDARGVHHIGTTADDMKGWEEVTTIASALSSLGVQEKIDIVTDTGPCQVTPQEWMMILVAAAKFRQPIWAKSFYLQSLPVIPDNFKDDKYWRTK